MNVKSEDTACGGGGWPERGVVLESGDERPRLSSHGPLVLVHGFTGAPEGWRTVVERLPAGVEIHPPEILGHAPDVGDPETGFAGEVDRLARWIEGRITQPAVLAGYSLGGRLALGLLVRHPRLFCAAVLIGVQPGLADPEARRQRIEADERLAQNLEEQGIESFVEFWESISLFASQRRLPMAVREHQRRRRLQHDPAGLATSLRVLGTGRMPDYWPQLAALDLPIHLMAGDEDDKFKGIAHAMAARLPRAAAEVVPEAGHNLLLEAPAAVAAAITGIAGRYPEAENTRLGNEAILEENP